MKSKMVVKALLIGCAAPILTGCLGAVVGVAVDTTTAVVKAPFQITGAVVGVAADTTGTVIAAPFRVVDAAFGGDSHHNHDHEEYDHEEHYDSEVHDHNHDSHEHFREHRNH